MQSQHGTLLAEPDAGECEDTCVTGEPQCPQVRCAAPALGTNIKHWPQALVFLKYLTEQVLAWTLAQTPWESLSLVGEWMEDREESALK